MKVAHRILVSIASVVIIAFSSAGADNSFRQFLQKTDKMKVIEQIYLDNSYVQRYNGYTGIWKDSRNLKFYAKKFGTDEETIRKANGLGSTRYISQSWIFYPYSDDYLKKLKEAGVEQLSWDIPRAEFLWPVKGNRITSRLGGRWGKQHTGIDIASARGSIVLAAQDGEVSFTGSNGAYGIAVQLDHGSDYSSIYGHLSMSLVKKGDKVKKGQIIAFSGNTGRSTGPHLHFEVRCMGMVLNPEFFLPSFDETMEVEGEFSSNLESIKPEIN